MSEATQSIKDALNKLLQTEKFKLNLARLKELNLNPFSLEVDGTPNGFADIKEARKIAGEIIDDGIIAVETACRDFKLTVTSKEKLDALAEWLDDQFKFNVIIELFDGPAFRVAISQGVTMLNKWFGQDWLSHLPAPQQ